MGSAIVTAFTSTFTTLGSAILELIKDGFDTLFYVDPSATSPVLSHIAEFTFVMLGLTLVVGITRWIVSLVRRKI